MDREYDREGGSSTHHITDILRSLKDEIEHRGIGEDREDRMLDRIDR